MSKNTKVEFGFGVGINWHGGKIPESKQVSSLEVIRALAVRLFGGCTLCRTVGDWRDEELDEIFSERGMTLFVLVNGGDESLPAKIDELAHFIKYHLDQKAVFVTRYPVESKLY